MQFLKKIYSWLFNPTYKVFSVEKENQFGTKYWTQCWHSRVEWWYWEGIFFLEKIVTLPSELNKKLQKYIQEMTHK